MTTDKGSVRVLVYGTLKQDGTNYPLLKQIGAGFLGYDSITATHRMLDLGPFPAVVDDKKRRRIRGEVYYMDEEGLAALDALEGHPHFFQRAKLWTDGGKRVWLYYLNAEGIQRAGPEVKSGMWQPSEDEEAFWDAPNG